MKVLFCTNDPITARLAYCSLAESGCSVDPASRPAEAVSMAIDREYDAVVLDSSDAGLSASDAACIIAETRGAGTTVVILGEDSGGYGTLSLKRPLDILELKRMMEGISRSAASVPHPTV